jgi:hypothetical protein
MNWELFGLGGVETWILRKRDLLEILAGPSEDLIVKGWLGLNGDWLLTLR